jgi:2-C-methyl-D-erythritol 4-phosphate cytidylyltransferase/2-C-methyl-D-erythritol 2,4-cyclodiphosphate synthase
MRDHVAALVLAAGRGTRAGTPLPKQWHDLGGRPVVAHALDAMRRAGVARLVLVVHPDDLAQAQALSAPDIVIVAGGATRAASVRAGLAALADTPPRHVLIHDGARPFVPVEVVDRVLDALATGPAAAPALPVSDALWRGADAQVTGLAPRDGLFRAQTPQGFDYALIRTAHDVHGGEAADDVEVARAAGLPVTIISGSEDNFKLTWPADFARALQMLRIKEGTGMRIRMGNGYDVHRFGPGDGCWLCGVKVPHGRALQGHSDADVGMHALTDAIYGALAEGDIGRHFPPSDPQWKGAASEIFLRHAIALARSKGFELGNCDVTLVCEYPKIGPHAQTMQDRLAAIMGVKAGLVSVKATTSERLGFTGREEGIAALASAVLIGA